MNVSGNDVKVLGKVVSIAVDNIVADAELVFDKNANLNQETINRNMTNAINQAVADVSSINTRVGSLEDALDDKLNISDYQTYATLMRESIMLKISEVEDEKQDVLTFDNTPTANSDNPVKSKGIKGYIDDAIDAFHSLFSTKKIIFRDPSEEDIEIGYIEGYTEYSAGSGLKKGVRIKGYSDYNQGRSEISLTEDEGSSGTTYAKIDAGDVSVYAGERASIYLTDPTITFDGSPATIDTNGISIVGSGYNANAPIEIKQTTGGEVDIISTEGNVLIHANTEANISASDVRVASENTGIVGSGEVTIFSGYGTTSPVTPGHISIEALDGPVAITGNPVTINGTDINTIKNNAQTALNKINAMYPDEGKGMQIETPGIYYAYPGFVDLDIIPSSMRHSITTGYLLLVTTEIEMDAHGGIYNYLHQLIIDIVTGRKAKRLIGYSDGTIDWSTAPNFTEV